MGAQSAPVQTVWLHGSVVSEGDVPALRDILGFLRGGTALRFSSAFHAALRSQGLEGQGDEVSDVADWGDAPDMVLTFGGDGTVLETAALLGDRSVPVLGINMGRLGFLAHLPLPGAEAALQSIFSGAYKVERRAMLAQRDIDDIHRAVDHLNLTTQWVQSKATDAQLEDLTDRLLMAMHDLRTVLVRKKADRLSKD